MLTRIHPKLPMRNKAATVDYYIRQPGFRRFGNADYPEYLMLERDQVQLHFFLYPDLDPKTNYGQVYIRTNDIDGLYRSLLDKQVPIHPHGALQLKPWGQKKFSLLDPDMNLLTFGDE